MGLAFYYYIIEFVLVIFHHNLQASPMSNRLVKGKSLVGFLDFFFFLALLLFGVNLINF